MATSRGCSTARHESCTADWCGCTCHKPKPSPPDPLLVADRDDWIDRAACAGQSADLFHADRTSGQKHRPPGGTVQEARALRFCARCPVRHECLMDVLRYEAESVDPVTGRHRRNHPQGISGGSTAEQRRRLKGTIEENAEELEWQFRRSIVPLILAPNEKVVT